LNLHRGLKPLREPLVALSGVLNDVAGGAFAFRRIDQRDVLNLELPHAAKRRPFSTFLVHWRRPGLGCSGPRSANGKGAQNNRRR
jgi:hypothetical protein